MFFIPIELVIIFGGLAVMREVRQVFFAHNYKNFGELFAYLWTLTIYLIIYNPPDGFVSQPFIRVGIFLIFLDKSIIFMSETYPLLLKYIKNILKKGKVMDELLTKLAIIGGILSPFISVFGIMISRMLDAKRIENETKATDSSIEEQEAKMRKLSIETSSAQLEHVSKIIEDLRIELEQYKSRTTELESKLEKSNARISELECNLTNSDTRIGELQVRLTQSNNRNSVLTIENDELRKQMEIQKEENIGLRKQMETQQAEIDGLKQKIAVLEQKKA